MDKCDKALCWKKKINNDTTVLLIISIISGIFGIISNSDEGIGLFVRSCLYFILLTIMMANKKEVKKYVGSFALLISFLMIVISIFTLSLFDVIFLIMGLFYMIHTLKFLKEIKKVPVEPKEKSQYSYLKYVSMLLIMVAVFLFITLGMFTDMSLVGLSIGGVVICSLNLVSFIICVISHIKKERTVLLYIYMVVSLLLTLLTGMFIVDDVRTEMRHKKRENSEEYFISLVNNASESISNNIINSEVLKEITIETNKENVVSINEFETIQEENYYLKELKEKGYTCEGYTILKFSDEADISYYYEILNNDYDMNYNMENFFSTKKTYISCTGKYEYQTEGFDFTKIVTN